MVLCDAGVFGELRGWDGGRQTEAEGRPLQAWDVTPGWEIRPTPSLTPAGSTQCMLSPDPSPERPACPHHSLWAPCPPAGCPLHLRAAPTGLVGSLWGQASWGLVLAWPLAGCVALDKSFGLSLGFPVCLWGCWECTLYWAPSGRPPQGPASHPWPSPSRPGVLGSQRQSQTHPGLFRPTPRGS